jgi:hypothetical protein
MVKQVGADLECGSSLRGHFQTNSDEEHKRAIGGEECGNMMVGEQKLSEMGGLKTQKEDEEES